MSMWYIFKADSATFSSIVLGFNKFLVLQNKKIYFLLLNYIGSKLVLKLKVVWPLK